jgi:S-DNA-T family DNA segregation ATPase FtsK/SpoIIIE
MSESSSTQAPVFREAVFRQEVAAGESSESPAGKRQEVLAVRQRAALQELLAAAAARAQAETAVETAYRTGREAVEAEWRQVQEQLQQELTTTQETAVRDFQTARQAILQRFEETHTRASRDLSAAQVRARSLFEEEQQKARAAYQDSRWKIGALYEAELEAAEKQRSDRQRALEQAWQHLQEQQRQALERLRRWRLADAAAQVVVPAPPVSEGNPFVGWQQTSLLVAQCRNTLERLWVARLLRGPRLFLALLAGWLVLLTPAYWMSARWLWLGASTAAVATIGLSLLAWLRAVRRSQALALYATLLLNLRAADLCRQRCLAQIQQDYQQQVAAARQRRRASRRKAVAWLRQQVQQARQRRDQALKAAAEKFQPLLDQATRQRDHDLRQAEARYQQLMAESNARYETAMQAAAQRRTQRLQELQATYEHDWQTLSQRWQETVHRCRAILEEVQKTCQQLFPDWANPCWQHWTPPVAVAPGLPFGTWTYLPERLPQVVPADARLATPTIVPPHMPALLEFPARSSLVLEVEGEGRRAAVRLLQALMLRALTATPPGKVRFLLFDPVGLGENFAAFSHLADHDEALVSGRIWTETSHLEQRLADLTEHIENVLQKYLRNQFQTLEEYNAQAGEIAEPYRILVIANFPVGFSVEAARRLRSILHSGPRCGVFTFLSRDLRLEVPQHFDPAELHTQACVLRWEQGQFHWEDDLFGRFPLQIAEPPADEFCTPLLQRVGEAARAASRVEVPFRLVAPPPEQWWTGDSSQGLRVPLGRAGAVKKQYLELGQGTAQHVLVAGKTGAGKSTLLHVLITQLALTYSPDEVELYLVDFKKGVEFKVYATYQLPHARVVAIESEREFGLSVLQRLDGELRRRGELFRQLGVADLPACRQALGRPVPRIFLIVDEFQEFFVEDDRIAQEAALLLDRLVRQGRAFGIHVLLGSQTLGGAYSLARATMDQMAVRIALPCSEADGHLILGKDNPAARLLSRPGEAIYNPANGQLESNQLFQVVWLSEEVREEYLRQIQQLAQARGWTPPPQIVFEGSAPGNLEKNPCLQELLAAPALPAETTPLRHGCRAWLGDPIAIKEPTAACFRRQSGANLLLVGQHSEAALGVLTAALLSLAAQLPQTEQPRFFWLGDPALDVPAAEGLLDRLRQLLPDLQWITWRQLASTLAELAAEVERRQQAQEFDAPARFLILYGLQRFRDLRKSEDDLGFLRRSADKGPTPAVLFQNLLRDGPPVGVFTLLWCDTLLNLNRTLERSTLRELEQRVLFQMSANDSSALMDSPAAARLGLHRAWFCTEEEGRSEKFRPYGLPTPSWLDHLATFLPARRQQQALPPGAESKRDSRQIEHRE